MKLTAFYLGSFLLLAPLPCCAQLQDGGASSTSNAKSPTPAANPQGDASTEKKKPKKVWTNDEIGSVKGDISVVGDSNSSSTTSADHKPSAPSGSDDAHQKQIQSYRDQISQLQAQIADIDKHIDQLKNFKGENSTPSGGINPTQGYNMVPVEDQVKQLEDKKKQLQAKVEDVEIDARKNGIDPGVLR